MEIHADSFKAIFLSRQSIYEDVTYFFKKCLKVNRLRADSKITCTNDNVISLSC